ncbi:hypothetical protein HGRIS_000457 [Hohenbuehelia grisea]|uniref:Glutamine synthetase n=1 Tax=Hohenbuehelia grisea TaxID=104357 RepID=A0ABR3JS19_9AGAR
MDVPLGVQYTPQALTRSAPNIQVNDLESHSVKFIRLQWVDYINCVHCRILPIKYFKRVLASPRPAISVPSAIFALVIDRLIDGFSAAGEYLYVPDLSTLRLCPYAQGHASLMGWIQAKAPQPDCDRSLAFEVDLCPRALVRGIETDAKSLGIEFLVGFETEFILLDMRSSFAPVGVADWAASAALLTGAPQTSILEEMAEALESAGIEVQMYHGEGAPGQYEIVTGPLTPLAAADALVHTRETIYNIANKHGLRATLAPRVFRESLGSSCHAHISVHSDSPSSPSEVSPHLTEVEASFLSNILAHLPALCALILPTTASYQRMQDDIASGGTYVCWGTEHREAPIRLANATSPSSRNFEVRPLDGTANPYLALAGLLGIGVQGIKERRPLTIKDCGDVYTAARISADDRRGLGITQRMALSLEEARENFQADQELRSVLGENLVSVFIKTNEVRVLSIAAVEACSCEVEKQALAAKYPAGFDDDQALSRLIQRY